MKLASKAFWLTLGLSVVTGDAYGFCFQQWVDHWNHIGPQYVQSCAKENDQICDPASVSPDIRKYLTKDPYGSYTSDRFGDDITIRMGFQCSNKIGLFINFSQMGSPGSRCQEVAEKWLEQMYAVALAGANKKCNWCPANNVLESTIGQRLSKSPALDGSKAWEKLTQQCLPTGIARARPREARRSDQTDALAETCRSATPTCSRMPRNDLGDQRDLRDLLRSEDRDDYATLDQVRILNAAGCLPLALKDIGRGLNRDEARARYRRLVREAVIKVHAACGRGVSDPDRRQNRQCPSPSFWNTQVFRDLQRQRPIQGGGGSEGGTPPEVVDGVLEDIKRYCTSRAL